MFSLNFQTTSSTDMLMKLVISRYLGMFSLNRSRAFGENMTVTCYFPLSWDVLIKYRDEWYSTDEYGLFPVILGCSH